MQKIIHITFSLIGYASTATVITIVLGIGYLWHTDRLNDEKTFRMIALLHDVDLQQLSEAQRGAEPEVPPEESSLDEVLQHQHVLDRNFEFKLLALQRGRQEYEHQLQQLKEKFEAAMNDDLNTAIALSVMFDLVRLANKLLENSSTTSDTLNAVDELFTKLGGDVLGIVKQEYAKVGGVDNELVEKLIDIVIDQRSKVRKDKDFTKSDQLRAKLDEVGIVLEDKSDGTGWRWK